jgi:hypothetical protein
VGKITVVGGLNALLERTVTLNRNLFLRFALTFAHETV